MSEYVEKTVLVLYVGGTIGMKKNDDGVFVPIPGVFLDRLKSIPELHDPELAEKVFPNIAENQLVLPQMDTTVVLYELKEYDPLLDSSNMTTTDWVKIAKYIEENYANFDSFVILHGTDTLAYTSSALSFMFEGLKKSVIITGAQISIFEPRSDAVNNLLTALILCTFNIPEVCVFFGNKLLRGNRTVKISPSRLDAFESPNFGYLGTIETDISIHTDRILSPSSDPFVVNTNLSTNVGILTFFPTITASLIENVLQSLSGVVIQSYGAGNIPSNQTDIINVLEKYVQKGTLIVNTTVCLQGSVAGIYETGQVLENIGVINGSDMTPEAALIKLAVVLGNSSLSYDERVQIVKDNIRGELTPLINNNLITCSNNNCNNRRN